MLGDFLLLGPCAPGRLLATPAARRTRCKFPVCSHLVWPPALDISRQMGMRCEHRIMTIAAMLQVHTWVSSELRVWLIVFHGLMAT